MSSMDELTGVYVEAGMKVQANDEVTGLYTETPYATQAARERLTGLYIEYPYGVAPIGRERFTGLYLETPFKNTDARSRVTGAYIEVLYYVVPNVLPAVSLVNPTDNSGYLVGDTLDAGAIATDPDGTIVRVDFYLGDTLIGVSTETPHTVAHPSLTAGTHTLFARAFDEVGGSADSEEVTILVDNPALPGMLIPPAGSLDDPEPPCNLPSTVWTTDD